jgi:hypothetical protein
MEVKKNQANQQQHLFDHQKDTNDFQTRDIMPKDFEISLYIQAKDNKFNWVFAAFISR